MNFYWLNKGKSKQTNQKVVRKDQSLITILTKDQSLDIFPQDKLVTAIAFKVQSLIIIHPKDQSMIISVTKEQSLGIVSKEQSLINIIPND